MTLPKIVQASQIKPFKFLFNGSLQDGLHYNAELYYRLHSWASTRRPQLYKLACRLSNQGADVVVVVAPKECSLWANLRNQKVAALAFSAVRPLPTADTLLQVQPVSQQLEQGIEQGMAMEAGDPDAPPVQQGTLAREIRSLEQAMGELGECSAGIPR